MFSVSMAPPSQGWFVFLSSIVETKPDIFVVLCCLMRVACFAQGDTDGPHVVSEGLSLGLWWIHRNQMFCVMCSNVGVDCGGRRGSSYHQTELKWGPSLAQVESNLSLISMRCILLDDQNTKVCKHMFNMPKGDDASKDVHSDTHAHPHYQHARSHNMLRTYTCIYTYIHIHECMHTPHTYIHTHLYMYMYGSPAMGKCSEQATPPT